MTLSPGEETFIEIDVLMVFSYCPNRISTLNVCHEQPAKAVLFHLKELTLSYLALMQSHVLRS